MKLCQQAQFYLDYIPNKALLLKEAGETLILSAVGMTKRWSKYVLLTYDEKENYIYIHGFFLL